MLPSLSAPQLKLSTLLCALFATLALHAADINVSHAIAMHGEPKYSEGFEHFEYANPDAPKGGRLRLAVISSGGFDSLNPFIVKGIPAAGLGYLGSSYLYESLTDRSSDEAFTEYGRIAERIEWPVDRSWVAYHINPKARFHDGVAITAEDVKFSFELLTQQGHPLYRSYYANVSSIEILDTLSIRFNFEDGDNRELALIVGQLPILPKHFWADKDFNKTGLTPPLGSGAYKVASVTPGRKVVYQRVEDYWGQDLPSQRGLNNFDQVSFDYYRDDTVAIEALKANEYDLRFENSAKNWATLYNGKPFKNQRMNKEALPNQNPTGMQAFIYNTRRDLFKDPKVREALAYAFDFEWTNNQLFYGAYTRTQSYFSNSAMAAKALPDAAEIALLEPYREQLPARLFSEVYQPPKTRGDGKIRSNLRQATKLLKEAGWAIDGKVLMHQTSGEIFKFELLLNSQSFEKVVLPFKKNLQRLGIEVDVRLVDTQQYIERYRRFDFDMVISGFGQSSSPGNEQRDFWHSSQASKEGSRNSIGIQSPVIDQLIEGVITAKDREDLVLKTRALDRVLQWGFYVIPNWHIASDRLAYWNRFARPDILPSYGVKLDTWWEKSPVRAKQNKE